MANVHNLFYSTDSEKITLHRNIIPTDEQQRTQRERWDDLCNYLKEDLKEDSGYDISSWLQGSYKFGTQIRPANKFDEFDIDLGIYFNWNDESDNGEYSPKELKSFVQNCLLKYKDDAKDDVTKITQPAKERCSRITFLGNFHIDIPAYHLNEQDDNRMLATENYGWEKSDPKALYEWFKDLFSDKENSQVRRIVRYFKIWSKLNLDIKIPSVLITVLVAEAFMKLEESETERDDEAFKNVVENILERISNDFDVRNPVNEEESLNRLSEEESDKFINKLSELIEISKKALEAKNETDSAIIWADIFHHFFPFPEVAESKSASNNILPATIKFFPKVMVEAQSKTNINLKYRDFNKIGPIVRDCDIKFTLLNTNELPPNSQIKWIVRNEGEEANIKNDLGHLAGNNLFEAEEESAYKGTHYMDLTVTSIYGEVLGYLRIPVTITGIVAPPRNPRKPWYTRFKNKRR